MTIRLSIYALMLTLPLASVVRAQGVPPVRKGTFELNGAVGYTYGIDEGAGDRSRVLGGGTLSYAVSKVFLPYVEYTYFPAFSRTTNGTLSNGVTFVSNYSTPLNDFHGGVHVRIPIRESRLVPYGVIGFGVLHAPQRNANIVYSNGSTQNPKQDSFTDYATNFGGGFRYYFNQHYGVRLEGKVYKPTGTITDIFGKLEGGFFVQFP